MISHIPIIYTHNYTLCFSAEGTTSTSTSATSTTTEPTTTSSSTSSTTSITTEPTTSTSTGEHLNCVTRYAELLLEKLMQRKYYRWTSMSIRYI